VLERTAATTLFAQISLAWAATKARLAAALRSSRDSVTGLPPRLSLEVDLTRAQHERNIAGGALEGTATGVFGDLVYHFGEGRTQVFVVGSLGVLKSDITQTYPIAGATQTFTSDESSFAWGGGAGVKVFLKPQISVRPQFRLVLSEETGVMGQATGSVAVGFHW